MHARKAYLKGLNPHENRTVPPLKYEWGNLYIYQISLLIKERISINLIYIKWWN